MLLHDEYSISDTLSHDGKITVLIRFDHAAQIAPVHHLAIKEHVLNATQSLLVAIQSDVVSMSSKEAMTE